MLGPMAPVVIVVMLVCDPPDVGLVELAGTIVCEPEAVAVVEG